MRMYFAKITDYIFEKKEASLKVKTNSSIYKTRVIFPNGLYSKPKGNVALLFESLGKVFSFPVQKHIDLEDGDVYITDNDKNNIHLKYKDGIIEIQGDTVFANDVKIKGNLEVEGNIKTKGDLDVEKNVKVTQDIESKNIKVTDTVESMNVKAQNKVEASEVDAKISLKGGGIEQTTHTHGYTDTTGVGPVIQSYTQPPV